MTWRPVVAAGIVALAACTGGGGDAPATSSGSLVVVDEDGAVSRVAADSGDVQDLGGRTGRDVPVQATPSPDGSTVVWSEFADGTSAVVVHERGEVRRIEVPSAPYFYQFSPDGQRLAALGNHPDGGTVALMMVDLGSDSAALVDAGQPYYLDWHPDSTRLAAHVGADVLASVAPTGERTPIEVLPGAFQAPAWTDEDDLVAVVGVQGVTAAGRPVATAISGHDRLAQGGGPMIARIDPASSDVTPVVEVAGPVGLDVAGDRIAWLAQGGDDAGTLSVVGLDGHDRHEVADTVVAFEWSPDGSLLLFHTLDRQQGLVPHVWAGPGDDQTTTYPGGLPTSTFLTEYLPFWPQYARSVTQWAPDSTAFATATTSDGGPGTVWLQPLDGQRREVGPGEMVTWSP